MNEEKLQKALVALECDAQINRILLCELIAQSPNPEALLQRFQAQIDSMTVHAPQGVDLELLVELRARAEQTVLLARRAPPYASAAR